MSMSSVPVNAQEPPAQYDKVYWIFAHPDDETLAAGASIARSQAAGNHNTVIILSSGENTAVRERHSLTRAQVVTSRLLETLDALKTINVGDVRFLSIADGEITVQRVESLIELLLAESKGRKVAFRGHSPTDEYEGLNCGHSDHCAVGRALMAKWLEGKIEALEFFRIGHLLGGPQKGQCRALTPEEQETKQRMLDAYAVQDPTRSRFAIGMHSVTAAMANAARMPECVEQPSSVWNVGPASDDASEGCEVGWSVWREDTSLRATCRQEALP